MANELQRILFSISVVSPTLVVTAIIQGLTKQWSVLAIALLISGLIFSVYDFILVYVCKKRIEKVNVSFDSLTPNDSWCIAYIITYIIPCLSIVAEPINPLATGIVAILIGLVIAAANIIPPNPLLRIAGYHFYKATSIDGVSNYNLISKRVGIHNRATVKTVVCAFDYILIEG